MVGVVTAGVVDVDDIDVCIDVDVDEKPNENELGTELVVEDDV